MGRLSNGAPLPFRDLWDVSDKRRNQEWASIRLWEGFDAAVFPAYNSRHKLNAMRQESLMKYLSLKSVT